MLRVEVFKEFGGRTWENVYLVGPDSFGEDTLDPEVATVIANSERVFHAAVVQFTYARVSTLVQGDNNYITVPLGFAGQRSVDGAGAMLPLFNTLRVDIQSTAGRPSRKFFRGVLTELDITYTSVNENALAEAQAGVNAIITELATDTSYRLRDPQGQALVAAIAYPRVQMRQLNRGRRRAAATPTP